MTSSLTTNKSSLATIWRNGLIAAVSAAVLNALIYVVGASAGGFPQDVITPAGYPVALSAVLIMSVVPILIGTLVYTLLNRFVANPNRWFLIIAALVFIVQIFPPLSLQSAGAPLLMIVLLEVMHVIAAGAAVYFLVFNPAR